MPSPDYTEWSLCFSAAPSLKLSKAQTLEFMPGVFRKTEPIEVTSIKAGPQTTDSSRNSREGKRKECMPRACGEGKEENCTTGHFCH